MNYVSAAQFRKTHQGAIAKEVSVDAPVADSERRLITFTVSSAEPDRDGDVIIQAGIDTCNYKRNPVMLWGHDSSELPIGRCIDIGLNPITGNLTATFEMVDKDVPCVGPKAEAVYQLCKQGFLFAVSIGFLPVEWERIDKDETGYLFRKVSLLEISCVSIPANPEALIIPDKQQENADQAKSTEILNTPDASAMARRKRLFEYISRR